MKFLVVGVGALGSAYLAFLSRAGYKAVGLLKKGRKLQSIRVEGIWGEFTQEVKAIDTLDALDFEPDITILTVKSYDTTQALKDIQKLKDTKSLLMVAQNGYGNYEKAIEVFGKGRVIVPHPIEKYSTGRGFAGKGTISSLVNRRRTFLAPTTSASSSYPHRRHLKCSPLRFNLS